MEQEKDTRDLLINGENQSSSSNEINNITQPVQLKQKNKIQKKGSGYQQQANKTYNTSEHSQKKLIQNSTKRQNSRGRVQIMAQNQKNYNNNRENLSIPAHLRWSQFEEYNGSQSTNLLMMTPDALLTKNTKAMAQLAPLQNIPNHQMVHMQDNQKQVNIPSLEQLQEKNKLQPLNHVPRKK